MEIIDTKGGIGRSFLFMVKGLHEYCANFRPKPRMNYSGQKLDLVVLDALKPALGFLRREMNLNSARSRSGDLWINSSMLYR